MLVSPGAVSINTKTKQTHNSHYSGTMFIHISV